MLPPPGVQPLTRADLDAALASFGDQVVERISDAVTGLRAEMDQGFAQQDARIDRLAIAMDERFTEQDARIDERFAAQDARIEQRFADQEGHLTERLAAQEERFDLTLDKRFFELTAVFRGELVRTVILSILTAVVGLGGFALALAQVIR